MAIDSPETTGGAPACRPEPRGGRQDRNFVDARGMTAQPAGEESCGPPLRHSRARRSRSSGRSAISRGHGVRRRQPCGEIGQPVVFHGRGAGCQEISVSRHHADRTVSLAKRIRWPAPCSLCFRRDKRDVDAGPPVAPVARHAFSALKLAAVSLRLGLYRASLAERKALLYPDPWSARAHTMWTDRPMLTFWTRSDQVF